MNKPIKLYDGIRGIAFLLVVLVHGGQICVDGAFRYLQGCGKYGVWLFFVLSAYLLTTNYLLSKKTKREYLLGRVLRIIPLYLLTVTIYTIVGMCEPTGTDWLKVAFGLYGPLHLWTIPVEFSFYFILLALWYIPNFRVRTLVFFVGALGSVLALIFTVKEANSLNPLWYLSSFYIGYLLAILPKNSLPSRVSEFIPFMIIAGFIFLTPLVQYIIFTVEPTSYLMNMHFPLSLLWGIFIYVLHSSPSLASSICSGKLFCFLGKISYSGYLFHWLVIMSAQRYLGSGISTALLAILASIIVAWILYRYLELPIYNLRKKWL